jgi:two-component system chemotaxis response regulator CheB
MKLAANKREGGPAARVLALGASTGGTQALPVLLASHPPQGVGCVMVQHMPAGFTEGFAARLNELSPWMVREARHGDLLREGDALLAPGDRHMALKRQGKFWVVELLDGPPVHFVRPSVDILFSSVAKEAGPLAAGALLTGMGRDGAAGLLAMRRAGASTFCQDQESSVVFGMPKEAWEAGAAEAMLPLDQLAPALQRSLGRLLLPGASR